MLTGLTKSLFAMLIWSLVVSASALASGGVSGTATPSSGVHCGNGRLG